MRFALHGRTTLAPFCAFAGTSIITLNDSEDLRKDYTANSEWTIIAGSIKENDVRRGNLHLLYNKDYLLISQMPDKEKNIVWVKVHQSTTWVQQEENIFLPGAWLYSGERRLGHGIVLCPSSVHTTWYVVEESWPQEAESSRKEIF